MKKFKIYEFDESTDDNNIDIVKVKVSAKAEKLADKCRKLSMQHTNTLSELMRELNKDNPDVDFESFIHDDFGFFTGELIS